MQKAGENDNEKESDSDSPCIFLPHYSSMQRRMHTQERKK